MRWPKSRTQRSAWSGSNRPRRGSSTAWTCRTISSRFRVRRSSSPEVIQVGRAVIESFSGRRQPRPERGEETRVGRKLGGRAVIVDLDAGKGRRHRIDARHDLVEHCRYPRLVEPAVDPDHADHRSLRGLDVGPGNVDRRPAARYVGFGQEKAPGADDVRRTADARDHVGRPGPLPDIGIVRQGCRRGPNLRHRPRQPDHAQQHRGEQPHDAFLWHRHRPAGSLHHSRRLHSPLSAASTMSCAWSSTLRRCSSSLKLSP